MIKIMTFLLTLLIFMPVLTVTITTPVLLSILRGLFFMTSNLASFYRVNLTITIQGDRPALLAVRFSLPLLLINGWRGRGVDRPVLAGDISIRWGRSSSNRLNVRTKNHIWAVWFMMISFEAHPTKGVLVTLR